MNMAIALREHLECKINFKNETKTVSRSNISIAHRSPQVLQFSPVLCCHCPAHPNLKLHSYTADFPGVVTGLVHVCQAHKLRQKHSIYPRKTITFDSATHSLCCQIGILASSCVKVCVDAPVLPFRQINRVCTNVTGFRCSIQKEVTPAVDWSSYLCMGHLILCPSWIAYF